MDIVYAILRSWFVLWMLVAAVVVGLAWLNVRAYK